MDEPDRSKWRYEDDGAPAEAAEQFVGLLKALTKERLQGDSISDRLKELRPLVTAESWPNWQRAALAGFDVQWLNQFTGHLSLVRYPADGMAYVFYPITHPDQTEDIPITQPQYMEGHVVTLVEERGAWRVHQASGGMVAPQDLGLKPYSW